MTSYVYDPKSDIEKERLLERDKRTSQRRSFALEGIEIPRGSTILDVGCGTGVLGFDLSSRYPDSSLSFIDLEPAILLEAKSSQPHDQCASFIASDASALPFCGKSFDVVACQYLLQHLNNPVHVLGEMRRVSKKGALAFVFEWDDGVNFTHPGLPAELDTVFEAKGKLINRRGGDRSIGRKLYHHLSASGWQDIEVRIVHDIWQGPDDRTAALKGTELSLLELKPQLLNESFVTESEFDLALQQLYDFYCGDIFSVVFFFAAYAVNLDI
jgi:ubiquinone/menaquinone biosynthesis C-methylase UbiE